MNIEKDRNGMIKTTIKQMEYKDGKLHLKWLHMHLVLFKKELQLKLNSQIQLVENVLKFN